MTRSESTGPKSAPLRLFVAAVPVLAVLALVLLAWQSVVMLTGIPAFLLPGPWAVVQAAFQMTELLGLATLRTAVAACCGLLLSAVAGTLSAFVFSQSAVIRRSLYPWAVLLQTVPIIAVAPIVLIAFGRGLFSIVLVSSMLSLFPILTSTTTGLLQIDHNLLDLFRLNGATRWQILTRLRIPSCLPFLISGLRIASGSAIVGAIVGEFFVGAAQPGLGALIQQKSQGLQTAQLYAVVLACTLLGTLAFGLISVLGDWCLWHWCGIRPADSTSGQADSSR